MSGFVKLPRDAIGKHFRDRFSVGLLKLKWQTKVLICVRTSIIALEIDRPPCCSRKMRMIRGALRSGGAQKFRGRHGTTPQEGVKSASKQERIEADGFLEALETSS